MLKEELLKLQREAEIYITHLKPGQIELTMQEIEEFIGEYKPRMLQNNQVFDSVGPPDEREFHIHGGLSRLNRWARCRPTACARFPACAVEKVSRNLDPFRLKGTAGPGGLPRQGRAEARYPDSSSEILVGGTDAACGRALAGSAQAALAPRRSPMSS
jgi:hypothetical protein